VFSGFALVVNLLIPGRKFLGLENVVTIDHLANMNSIILATGMIVSYGYGLEHFMAWYSGSEYESTLFFETRGRGPYAFFYWLMLFCNCVAPQVYWFRSMRRSIPVMFVVAILVNIGMWLERFVIIVISLHRDFLPSSWSMYYPTWVDLCMFLGTMGFFTTAFLLFLRFLPAVAVSEVKELNYEYNHAESGEGAH
jgi:molybdopterin-containing oxidoreductase family membrane subunit